MFKKILILIILMLLASMAYFVKVSIDRKHTILKMKEIYSFEEYLEKENIGYEKKVLKNLAEEYKIKLDEGEELRYKFKYVKPEKTEKGIKIRSEMKTIFINIEYLPKLKLAILIDDVSMRSDTAYDFLKIDKKLTFAAIPFTPNMKKAKKILTEAGFPMILHMPMESIGNSYLNNKTKGLVKTTMSNTEVENSFIAALEDVGEVEGFNNHMGSKFTSNREKMDIVLNLAKKRGLYYVDSRTSRKSIAFDLAKEKKISSYYCSIFLDNKKETEYIKERIKLAVERTKKNGKVLAIGHYHKATAKAILEMLPYIEKQGVELVYVKDVLE